MNLCGGIADCYLWIILYELPLMKKYHATNLSSPWSAEQTRNLINLDSLFLCLVSSFESFSHLSDWLRPFLHLALMLSLTQRVFKLFWGSEIFFTSTMHLALDHSPCITVYIFYIIAEQNNNINGFYLYSNRKFIFLLLKIEKKGRFQINHDLKWKLPSNW